MTFALFGLQEWLFWLFRVAAGIGTAVLCYFLLGPVIQALARVALHRRLPSWIVVWVRILGGILLGMLVYYYLPIGGGPGWGPGSGGPSEGKGTGENGKGKPGLPDTSPKQQTGTETGKEATETAKDILQIELLGGTRYKRDERYYLLDRKEPAKTLPEVDDYLKENAGKYKIVHVILTKESVSEEDPAVSRLQRLAQQKYKLAAPIVLP